MKKLTAEEAQDMHPLRPGRFTLLYTQLMQMKVGEALIIERGKDWVTKYPPYNTIRNVAKNTGFVFDFGRMPDVSGWLVKRVK